MDPTIINDTITSLFLKIERKRKFKHKSW